MNIGFSSSVFAITGDLTNDPAKIVKKYLSLDKRGARLHAITSEVLTPYIAWTHEPAWGQIVVIEHVSMIQNDIRLWDVIQSCRSRHPGHLSCLGGHAMGNGHLLIRTSYMETMRFRVRAIDNHWQIVEPMLPPHVGKKRLMDHVRLAWLEETDIRPKKERLDLLWKTLETRDSAPPHTSDRHPVTHF